MSSLATRCPTCGTVFRVVQDQLLVSEGWVRCGRCSGVFNAADDLLDITTGLPVQLAPPPGAVKPPRRATPEAAPATPEPADLPDLDGGWQAAPTAAERAAAPGPVPDPALAAAPPAAAATPPAPLPEPLRVPPQVPPPALPEPLPAEPGLARDHASPGPLLRAPSQDLSPAEAAEPAGTEAHAGGEPLDARSGLPARLSATLADPDHAAAPALAAMAAFPQELPPPAEPAPEFVRAADRAAQWRRPPVRAGALAAALALGALALAQTALLWRDPLAAQHPGWAAALQTLCRVAGCQVQPLHRIEQLSVDASGLSRVEAASATDDAASAPVRADAPRYRLNLTLRNRADTALAAPAVELSLTDSNGQLVLRKVLRLAELGAPQTVIAAGQELSLQTLLAVGEHRIDGYTVELFYP